MSNGSGIAGASTQATTEHQVSDITKIYYTEMGYHLSGSDGMAAIDIYNEKMFTSVSENLDNMGQTII